MDEKTRAEYVRLRKLGLSAAQAKRDAEINVVWENLEADGLVRFRFEAEQQPHDLSYVDTWGLSEGRAAREKQRIRDIIERDGCWVVFSEVLVPECACCGNGAHWESVDNIGDFVGDFRDCGYDVDLKRAALDHIASTTPQKLSA